MPGVIEAITTVLHRRAIIQHIVFRPLARETGLSVPVGQRITVPKGAICYAEEVHSEVGLEEGGIEDVTAAVDVRHYGFCFVRLGRRAGPGGAGPERPLDSVKLERESDVAPETLTLDLSV